MEAAAFALDLFGKVHRLLAHPTLLASSPVRHPGSGHREGNEFSREAETRMAQDSAWGRGLPRQQPGGFPPQSHRGPLRSHSIFSPLPGPLGHKLARDTGWCTNNNKPFAVCIHVVSLTAKEAGELEPIKHELSVSGLKQAKLSVKGGTHVWESYKERQG